MILDEPMKPEFGSWNSYSQFARRVRQKNRYVWGDKETAFLGTVLATIRKRDGILNEGTVFYRAQLGVDWQDLKDEEGNLIGEDVRAYGSSRMKPLELR